VAGNGREGMAHLENVPLTWSLLDLALPDKNGMDVLAEIRVLHPQQAVIMITAYARWENAVRAMQSGATTSSEAVGQRKTVGRRACGRRSPESGRRKRSAQARAQTALQL